MYVFDPLYPSLCRNERRIDVKLPSAVRSHFNTHASRLLLSAMISAWFPKLRFQRLHIISVFTYLLFILKPEWRSPVWLIIPKKEELWLPSVTSQQAHFHSRGASRTGKDFSPLWGVQWQAADALLQHISEAHLTRGPWKWRSQSARRHFLQKRDAEVYLRDFFLRDGWVYRNSFGKWFVLLIAETLLVVAIKCCLT